MDNEIKTCTVGISPDGVCEYASVGEAPAKEVMKMLRDGYSIEKQSVEWCRKNLFQKVR